MNFASDFQLLQELIKAMACWDDKQCCRRKAAHSMVHFETGNKP
jgi:hypothetical protein